MSSLDFHAAADGRGPTFTLLRVSDGPGRAWLVGGYNPQSWDSDDGWHFTPRDFQRTAFVFNYTAPAVYRQVPSSFELPSQGSFQTFNARDQGPTFGAGPDLFVDDTLRTALSWRLSYGDPAGEGRSIIDGSVGGRFFAVDALEIYAVSPIPEPAGATMLAGGLALAAFAAAGAARRDAQPVNATHHGHPSLTGSHACLRGAARLAWLQAGATASYGTVGEPCNHWQKFPNPSVLSRASAHSLMGSSLSPIGLMCGHRLVIWRRYYTFANNQLLLYQQTFDHPSADRNPLHDKTSCIDQFTGRLTVLAALIAGLAAPAMAAPGSVVDQPGLRRRRQNGATYKNDFIELFNRSAARYPG